jgi:hypothetical protein
MNLEFMRSELDRAVEAELQSEEQLRQLVGHIDKVCAPNSTLDASDCAKTVIAALALNERLRDRKTKLQLAVKAADPTSPSAVMMAKFKAASQKKTP